MCVCVSVCVSVRVSEIHSGTFHKQPYKALKVMHPVSRFTACDS